MRADTPPGADLRELTLQALFEPNNEAAVTQAASTFAAGVGSLLITEPELRIHTPGQETDEQRRAEMLAAIEKCMDEAGFNEKERAVSRLILLDMTYAEIARELTISKHAVTWHAKGARDKCGSRTRAGLSAYLQGLAKGKNRATLIAAPVTDTRTPSRQPLTFDGPTTVTVSYEQVMTHYGLTTREREVALLAKDGLSNAEIGEELHLSEPTIKGYMSGVFEKMGINKRSGIGAKLLGSLSKETTPLEISPSQDKTWKATQDYWIQGEPLTAEELAMLYDLSKARLLNNGLEKRAIDVAIMTVQDHDNETIAQSIGVKPLTIPSYLQQAFDRTGHNSRPKLAHHVLIPPLRQIVSLSLGPLNISGHTPKQRTELVNSILEQRCRKRMISFQFTDTEQDIGLQILDGRPYTDVFAALGLTRAGFYPYRRSIFEKTGINNNRVHLLRKVYGIEIQ